MGYLYPVSFSRSTSWAAHRRRKPPSSEPGIDMFCPVGTPVLAAEAGVIAGTGDSILPATGRFVTIDLDDGRRVRYLHLSRRTVKIGDRVTRGQVIGYSGATGYGEEDWSWNVAETGGAHVHMTLWPQHRYVFTTTGTLDPEPYFDAGGFAASDAKPFEEDDMYDDNAKKDAADRHSEIMAALEKVHRAAAPFKVLSWGTGLVVYNPSNGKLWILPPGYSDLLQALGLTGGNPVSANTDQLGFATGFLPATIGDSTETGGDGFTEADLEAIKTAIAQAQVAVTPEQLQTLLDTVGAAARDGGEDGAKEALRELTFVVTAS